MTEGSAKLRFRLEGRVKVPNPYKQKELKKE